MLFSAQNLIFDLLMVGVFVLCVVALVDALRRPPAAFVSGGKRTKGFWGAILGVATAIAFVGMPPLSARGILFLVVIAAVAAAVYLVDVRPAIAPYSGRGGGRPGRGW